MASQPPPPPPPPHGQAPRPPGSDQNNHQNQNQHQNQHQNQNNPNNPSGGPNTGSGKGGLPDGNYDIFIIPPHSAGGGFLYLPSMQPHRNSFLLGVASTLLAVGLWTLCMPVLQRWFSTLLSSGGMGVILLVLGVGVAGWAWGKTQGEMNGEYGAGGGEGRKQRHKKYTSSKGTHSDYSSVPPQSEYSAPPHSEYSSAPPQSEYSSAPPPKSEYSSNPPQSEYTQSDYSSVPPQSEWSPPPPKHGNTKSGAASGWEKAREETRKREEERKRAEELRKKREEVQKAREQAEREKKIKAEKEKWEQARAREKEQRERDARERIAKERAAKEAAAKASQTSPSKPASPRKYEQPSAKSFVGSEDGRPSPSKHRSPYKSSVSSVSDEDRSSYAASHSTARTTPPPSHSGIPYSTTDPTKIQIRAVYLFSDSSPTKPLAELIARRGAVTDGLVLRITSEGLFIDDDVRGVPQREWDVKAWTLKLVEDGMANVPVSPFIAGTLSTVSNSGLVALHVLRATARDADHKRYTFVLDEREAWKVAIGLQKLRKGSQVRSLGMSGLKENDVKVLLGGLGWM